MIDAYEIGIQLMLQDDVSAGLVVINRGLADVDRAVAATSADLAGMGRNAETALKAVAIAMNGRTAFVPLPGQKSMAALNESGQENLSRPSPMASAPTSIGVTPPAMSPFVTAPVAPEKQVGNQDVNGLVQSKPGFDGPVASSSAPLKSAISDSFLNSGLAETQRTEPEGAPKSFSSGQVAPTALMVSAVVASPAEGTAATLQQPHRSATPSVTPMAFTASVSRELLPPTAAPQSQQIEYRPLSSPSSRRERPVAPWSGVNQPSTQFAALRPQEKAAAPQTTGRGQAENTGGTVMLDGRLVGQWLSEQMGREASRPPAGTSFFDPRQTPACNVSGAL